LRVDWGMPLAARTSRRRILIGLFALGGVAAGVGFWATGGGAPEDYALLALALWLGHLLGRAVRGREEGLALLAMRTLGAFLLYTAFLSLRHLNQGLWPSLLWTPLVYPGAYVALSPEAARVFLLRYFLLLVGVSFLSFGLSGEFGDAGLWNTYLQWLASQAGLWVLSSRIFEMGRRAAHAEEEARTDPLTGAANRRGFLEALEAEMRQSARQRLPPLLLAIDLDRFKEVNDRHGHARGDEVLRRIAATLAAHLREGDLLARTGGDEFAILLYDCPASEGQMIADRLCRAVDAAREPLAGVTLSVGLGRLLPGETPARFLARVDGLLYRAKRAGGNRVAVAAGV